MAGHSCEAFHTRLIPIGSGLTSRLVACRQYSVRNIQPLSSSPPQVSRTYTMVSVPSSVCPHPDARASAAEGFRNA
jgi:hypothetical protein